jgi:hypothetical protein
MNPFEYSRVIANTLNVAKEAGEHDRLVLERMEAGMSLKWSRLSLMDVCKMIIPTERNDTERKGKNIRERLENI